MSQRRSFFQVQLKPYHHHPLGHAMNFELKLGDEASTRYGRACRLVIEAGTRSVKDFVLDNLNPPRAEGLPATLRALRELFDKLRRGSVITLDQFQVLYPPLEKEVRLEDLDLTMWVVLVRNATTASDKSMKRVKSIAPDNEQTARSHVFKIRDARNKLFHKSRHELDEVECEQIWWDVTAAILYLGRVTPSVQHIDKKTELELLKNGDLDQQSTANSVFLVQKQTLEELRRIAIKEASRRQWTLVALVLHLVLAVATIGGVLVAVLVYTRQNAGDDCKTCADNVEYISTNGGIVMHLPRRGWSAVEPREEPVQLKTPVKYVIISHTALLGRCTTTDDCCRDARKVQQFNIETSNFNDIAYNGLIGDSGVVLDGRGFDVQAATARGWNHRSLGFAFMGMFIRESPREDALSALQNFLVHLVDVRILTRDYIIYALCQVRPFPDSPGDSLYREIQTWPHWHNRTGGRCRVT